MLGIVTLAGGYILALKADNVMTGLNTFFCGSTSRYRRNVFPVYGREHCLSETAAENNATIIKQIILFRFPE